MKKKQLLTIGFAVLLLASCGPRRYSCGGKRRCIVQKETIEKNKMPERISQHQKTIG